MILSSVLSKIVHYMSHKVLVLIKNSCNAHKIGPMLLTPSPDLVYKPGLFGLAKAKGILAQLNQTQLLYHQSTPKRCLSLDIETAHTPYARLPATINTKMVKSLISCEQIMTFLLC